MIRDPVLYCLEDNSTEIDFRVTDCILATIDQKRTTLITSNDPNIIKVVQRVAVLENGQITESGSFEDLSKTSPNFFLAQSEIRKGAPYPEPDSFY